jgi:hypothetical protein
LNIQHIILPHIHSLGKNAEKMASLSLKRGDVIKAKIVGHISPRQVILNIDERHVVAQTSSKLSEGADAYFRVVQSKPDCVLRLMEMRYVNPENGMVISKGLGTSAFPSEKVFEIFAAALRSVTLEKNATMPENLKYMWDLFSRVLPDKNGIDAEGLKAFLQGCGFSWENKLRTLVLNRTTESSFVDEQIKNDLKGLSLQALSDKSSGYFLKPEIIENFVDNLQRLQLLNLSC